MIFISINKPQWGDLCKYLHFISSLQRNVTNFFTITNVYQVQDAVQDDKSLDRLSARDGRKKEKKKKSLLPEWSEA